MITVPVVRVIAGHASCGSRWRHISNDSFLVVINRLLRRTSHWGTTHRRAAHRGCAHWRGSRLVKGGRRHWLRHVRRRRLVVNRWWCRSRHWHRLRYVLNGRRSWSCLDGRCRCRRRWFLDNRRWRRRSLCWWWLRSRLPHCLWGCRQSSCGCLGFSRSSNFSLDYNGVSLVHDKYTKNLPFL